MLHQLRLSWYLPLWTTLRLTSQAAAIERDAVRHQRPLDSLDGLPPTGAARLSLILEGLSAPQVRSVAYTRLHFGSRGEQMLAKVFRRVSPGLREFELNCRDIGPGLVIGHGYGSVIWAERIGADCMIHQGVTVGCNDRQFPTLGDRVWISPGATILGGIRLGDDCTIAANAVVLADVPAGATVGGIPARVLTRKGGRPSAEAEESHRDASGNPTP